MLSLSSLWKQEVDFWECVESAAIIGQMTYQRCRLAANEEVREDRLAREFSGISPAKGLARTEGGFEVQVDTRKAAQIFIERLAWRPPAANSANVTELTASSSTALQFSKARTHG